MSAAFTGAHDPNMRYNSIFQHPIFHKPVRIFLSFFGTSTKPHDFLISISSVLFGLSLLFFLDAVMYSHKVNASDIVHISFIDWVPFLSSLLGLCIVNSVNKGYLVSSSSESGSEGNFLVGSSPLGGGNGGPAMSEIKVFLFLGFALLAGGSSGSIVILIVKYINKGIVEWPTVGMGVDCVIANGLVLVSCMILWVAQTSKYNTSDDEYNYSLTI